MKMVKKRGQLDLSFGLIFSVILIVAFLGFAIYAIINFLVMKDSMETGRFLNTLESNIDAFWKEDQGSQEFVYFLPIKIKEVCFLYRDLPKIGPKENLYDELRVYALDGKNLIFYPVGSSKAGDSAKIEHINLVEMTRQENPFCFENKNGKVTLTLEQAYGGKQLVSVKR